MTTHQQPRRYTETERRNSRVIGVLRASTQILGPTEIARRINESWCFQHGSPASSAITPILKRIGAVRHPGGHYSLDEGATK